VRARSSGEEMLDHACSVFRWQEKLKHASAAAMNAAETARLKLMATQEQARAAVCSRTPVPTSPPPPIAPFPTPRHMASHYADPHDQP
jgi:hypothetical protein